MISARTSPARFIKHSMWFKMPRGFWFFTNPRKAAYNRIYNRTSFSIWSLFSMKKNWIISSLFGIGLVLYIIWQIPNGARIIIILLIIGIAIYFFIKKENNRKLLINLEAEMRHTILESFTKRYSTDEEKLEHIVDLINLIYHQKSINLSMEDVKIILNINEEECRIEKTKKIMSEIKDKSPANVAKTLLKTTQIVFTPWAIQIFNKASVANMELACKKQIIESILDGFKGYCDRYGVKYNINELERNLDHEFTSQEATKFKEKLSRETDKKITVKDIAHMDWFEFEELLGRVYREAGYKVRVTKKSGDQWADLIVEKDWISTAIQAKRYSGSVWNSAVQEVVASKKFYDCDNAIVITTADFTRSAIQLAHRNGVELIDKKWLDKFFDSIL